MKTLDSSTVIAKPDLKIQNTFNVEQLALESMNLKNAITGSEPILNYLRGKSSLREDDVKILKNAKMKQRR